MTSIAGPSNPVQPASDDDIQMTDSNGNVIPASIDVGAEIAAGEAATEGGDDDDDSDIAEGEYEIEHIVSHTEIDGVTSYFVKWKGYPESENSWVWASDMGGAQEMITEYWKKAPATTVKKMGTKKGAKKNKRQSSASAITSAKQGAARSSQKRTRRESSLLNVDSPASTKTKSKRNGVSSSLGAEYAPSRSPTPDDQLVDFDADPALSRIRSDPTLTDEQKEVLEAQHLHAIQLDRLRKRYARIPDWDPIVKKVEAVEKMSDNKLRVFLHFESGDRLAFESVVAHHRCPLKLLQFYESNLRFKRREEGEEEMAEEVGPKPLRGEEDQRELDEYNQNLATEAQANGTGAAAEGQEVEAELQTQDAEGGDSQVPQSSVGSGVTQALAEAGIESQSQPAEAAQEVAMEEEQAAGAAQEESGLPTTLSELVAAEENQASAVTAEGTAPAAQE